MKSISVFKPIHAVPALTAALLCLLPIPAAQAQAGTLSSESAVNWMDETFVSTVTFDIQKAGIHIPSGKKVAVNRMNIQTPVLIKDPLLSLPVDSALTLEDMIRSGSITMAQITDIIDGSKRTPVVFAQGSNTLSTVHTINLKEISSVLIKHHMPGHIQEPIEHVSSRPYTGIIIDARGALPVHGEFVSDSGIPCLFPSIWDENMEKLYDRNQVSPEAAKRQGIVRYDYSDDISRYSDLTGIDPLRITAREIYGINRTDPVITRADALKILSIPENRRLLQEGKVVILLDKDKLDYRASAPVKDGSYYLAYRTMQQYIYENKIPDVQITDRVPGIEIRMENLRFIADSAQLLPDEKPRLDSIAEMLLQMLEKTGYKIMVAGHTASVGKPNGEMTLSIQRAQAIIKELADRGIPEDIFSYQGYGGTVPIGDNGTNEGRAMNRRVEITAVPQSSYIQRDWQ